MKPPSRATVPFLAALCLLFGSPATTSAQTGAGDSNMWDVPRSGGETITEPSPDAAAMRRYQDYPVSYATGTADISIPLVALPGSGGRGVELGLSYHTGGIKRNDLTTGIGLGWTLTGLGQVSRQINGFPDEWKGTGNNVTFDLRENSTDVSYYQDILMAKKDTEYDRYSYNFAGYSGSFIIRDNIILQLPSTELAINRIPDPSNPKATDAFEITTPEGVVYRFEEKEHIEYLNRPDPIPVPSYSRNYSCVSAWNLSRITPAEGNDGIEITYTRASKWLRNHDLNMRSFGYRQSSLPGETGLTGSSDNNVASVNRTTFLDQCLPLKIKNRSGSVEFEIQRKFTTLLYGLDDRISAITLKDAAGRTISTVELKCGKFSDSRARLEAVGITKDGKLVSNYRFCYNNSAPGELYDLFGYPNGWNGSTVWACSVLDYDLTLSESRATNPDYVSASSLTTITDINGSETTIEYEPSTVNVHGKSWSFLNGEVVIGHRIRSITIKDKTVSRDRRTRKRSFNYHDPRCNLELENLTFHHFLSHSGVFTAQPVGGSVSLAYNPVYNMGTAFLASASMRGYPIENARIYYGKVEEYTEGTGLESPVLTTYEYDLDNCVYKHVGAGGNSGITSGIIGGSTSDKRHLGYFETIETVLPDGYRTAMQPHPVSGYNEEVLGGRPLLVRKTVYEKAGNEYQVRMIEESYNRAVTNRICEGLFCESNVYKIYYYKNGTTRLDIQSMNDINTFPVYFTSRRFVCDSTVTTTVYPDNSRRSVTTRYLYSGSIPSDSLPIFELQPERPMKSLGSNYPPVKDPVEFYDRKHLPGFGSDTIYYVGNRRSFYPLGKVVSSGGESVASYIAMSEYTGAKIKSAGCKLNRLPVVEKWVYRDGTGSDSLLRRYEYGRFRCGTDTLTRPTRVYITTYDADVQSRHTIYNRHYKAYDNRGRITAMTDADGRRISATWDSDYDLLTRMTLDDAGLTTTYTYTPLVGCTSITAPSGKKRQFGYQAGRLTGEKNTAGKPVASYSYELYGESTDGSPGRNLFTTTTHDDRGDATEAVLYDGFGMPVRTLSTVAGEGTVCSATAYDALDRPVRQYLPVPATTIDDTPGTSSHYRDRYAYKTYTYRHLASDKPLSVISEGELLQEHPAKFEYLCNSTTEPLLRCFKYTLSPSPEEETVTSKGYYPAGQLDITKTTDPDGCTMLTFTDWRGFKMLERRVVNEQKGEFADTYFLYDPMGRLRVTIQPEGSAMMTGKSGSEWSNSDDVMEQYAFIYRYDRRGNCVYSRVPGGGAERTYYDVYNRPAMHTTATLDEEGKTEVFLYDRIGRNALQCIVDVSFDTMIPYDFPKMTVRLDPSSTGIGGTGYIAEENDIQSILDTRNLIVTTANYYDSYDILSREEFSGIPGVENMDRQSKTALGQLTARRQAVYGADGNMTSFAESDTRYSVYSYNVEGHLTAAYDNLPAAKISTAKTIEYTRLGRPTLETTVVSTTGYPHTLEMATGYDASGAVSSMTATLDGDTISSSALYSYNPLGQLAKAEYDNKEVIYSYELDGKLSSIQSAVFSQSLYYETYPKPCYNGNVSYMRTDYSMMADGIEVEYTYDKLNRLVSTFSTDNQAATYTYNLNSSPLTITRHGLTSDGYSIGLVDDLTLSYSGNRLQRVTDSADPVLLEASSDFDAPEGEATFRYDTSGRMIQDTGRGIQNTVYAPNDRPLLFDMGDNASRISYSYMSDGTRLSRTRTIRTSVRESYRTIWYIGAFRLMTSSGRSRPMLDRVELPWGYFDYQGKAFVYIRDCQQNVRSVVDADGKFVQQTDYYPYGMPKANSNGQGVNRYKYSSKEYETENGLNLYDFEARMHDPATCLFRATDPKAGDYPWLNPYLYCAANPIAYIDPTGEEFKLVDNDIDYTINIVDNNVSIYDTDNNIVDTSSLSNATQVLFEWLQKIVETNTGNGVVQEIIDSEETIYLKAINDNRNNFNIGDRTIYYNPYYSQSGLSMHPLIFGLIRYRSADAGIVHEMGHVLDFIYGKLDNTPWIYIKGNAVPRAEISACELENKYRYECGYPLRVYYATLLKNIPSENSMLPNNLLFKQMYNFEYLLKFKYNSRWSD